MHYLEEQCPTASVAELKSAEAIIVLGADIRPGRAGNADRLGPQSLERLVLATEAYRQLALPVLTSGGRMPSSELAVSELMKRVLEEYFAVPVAWTENRSHTTYENALYVSEIMHRDGIDTIVIVAQLRDIPRITWSFEKFGLRVFAWPAPSTPVELNRIEDYLPSPEAFNNSFYAFHELIGQAYYRFRYGRTKLYG